MDPLAAFLGVKHADAIAFAVEESEAQAGRILGTACHFGRQNQNGWTLAHGSLDAWLAQFNRAGRKLPMLWSHETSEQIGSFHEARIEGDRLVLAGKLNLNVERAREVRSLILAGDSTGLSIGASVDDADMERSRNGLVFRKASLFETSVVAMPADDNARITVAASITTRVGFEKFLRESGFPRSAASKIAAKGWAAMPTGQAETQSQNDELIARIAAATTAMRKLQRGY